MKSLPGKVFTNSDFKFGTPSDVVKQYDPVAPIHIPHPISWADEETDLTAWLGNDLQDDAFDTLYNLTEIVRKIDNHEIRQDWLKLQTSDHFYYMCTKWFSDGDVHRYFNPFGSPYQAFITHMNVLSDFIIRVQKFKNENNILEDNVSEEELNNLIEKHDNLLKKLKSKKKTLEKVKENK